MPQPEILDLRGPEGVTGFASWKNDRGFVFSAGAYSDDTQLTIATAVGLLRGLQRWRRTHLEEMCADVYDRYQAWLSLQDVPSQSRYPGTTCLSALRRGRPGEVDDPVNDSKGSGGIMRIAPVGLAFEPCRAFEMGTEIAALTHCHPSGYLSAGAFAELVSRCARGDELTSAVTETRELLLGWEDCEETLEKLDLAMELFVSEADVDEAYELLGEGWVAEEALGVALFSALSFPEDFVEGVLAAVNITGDSDTTGALTGSLLGSLLGHDSIPDEWARDVEDAGLLLELADDLYDAFVNDVPLSWEKYPAG